MKIKNLKNLLAVLCSTILLASTASAQTGTVTADLLNVRTSPSTSSGVVEKLSQGTQVAITYGPEAGWCEIYRNGGCYYVSSDYVSVGTGATAETSYASSENVSTKVADSGTGSSQGTYLGNFTLTAYCPCTRCTGGSGITASGTTPVAGRTVAMAGVDFGTRLLINGHVYTVEDRGTSYGHVDIFMNSHSDALCFGVQYADVYLLD